jgi:superfamily II DNA or RNA helicase
MLDEIQRIFMMAWSLSPRPFQEESLRRFAIEFNHHRVASICPAAGKTKLGAAYAALGILAGKWKNVVVVSPTKETADNWARDMEKVGIKLARNIIKDITAEFDQSYHGVSVTYQSLMHTTTWFTAKFGYNTLAIFDEAHHLQEQNEWGKCAYEIFKHGTNSTLALSGTLWPPDLRKSLSFVRYNDKGIIVPDFTYSYSEALADEIVRSTSFPTWNARNVEYLKDGTRQFGSFSGNPGEDLSLLTLEELLRHPLADTWLSTLKACLDPTKGFLPAMIRAAHERLMSPLLRGGSDPSAAGLFVGYFVDQLDWIKKNIFVKRLGLRDEEVVVVHSGPDCDDPKGEITRARDNHKIKWILCVKMITEGVSIDRLRVGVMASIELTELRFLQIIGRTERRPVKEHAESFWFMPAHPILMFFAKNRDEERERARQLKLDRGTGNGGPGGPPSGQINLTAEGEEADHITANDSISRDDLEFASQTLARGRLQGAMSPALAASLLKAFGRQQSQQATTPPSAHATKDDSTYEEKKEKLSNQVHELQKQAAHANFRRECKRAGKEYVYEEHKDRFADEMRRIHKEVFLPLDGIRKHQKNSCTLGQLEARKTAIISYLKEIQDDGI